MSIEAKLERLALNKAAIKAAIENKNPSIPPTGDMDNWPTSIMSIPSSEPAPEPEPTSLYVRPSDWPDLETILAQHPASEKGYGYAYAMLVEGQNPVSPYNYIKVPPKSAGCRHYVTSWGLDEEPTNAWQTWVLSDPNTYNKYEWIVVYTDSDHDITLWQPNYHPYKYRWLVWFYAPGAVISNAGNGFCGIISMREVKAKEVTANSYFFEFEPNEICRIDVEKYTVIDNGNRNNGSPFPVFADTFIDFDIEIQSTARDMHDYFVSQYYLEKIKPFAVPSSITSLQSAFNGCTSLKELDLSQWDVSNVQSMSNTFSNCYSLKRIDTTGWTPNSITTLYQTFSSCFKLEDIGDVSNWNVSNVTSMFNTFYNCNSLKKLELLNWNVSKVTTMNYMFCNCYSLKELLLSGWDTSSVTNMSGTFRSCISAEKIDASNWDLTNVTTIATMFYDCRQAKIINLSGWKFGETPALQSASEAFRICLMVKNLDLSNWNTSTLTSIASFVSDCLSLESIDMTGWNTSAITNMSYAFNNCKNLRSLDMSGWNTGSVTVMNNMFSECRKIQVTGYKNLDVSKVTNMNSMFSGCISITEMDMSNWDLSSLTSATSMFSSCDSLFSIKLPKMTTVYNSQFIYCPSCILYDFRKCESVPVLQHTNAFTSINANAHIVVPDSLYSSWIAASNWSNSTIKSHIISVTDYEAL